MSGTWANVLTFFSGLPFVLSGLGLSPCYPTRFGGIGIVGGGAQLFAGVTMFLGLGLVPDVVAIAGAIFVSLWLGVVGVLL